MEKKGRSKSKNILFKALAGLARVIFSRVVMYGVLVMLQIVLFFSWIYNLNEHLGSFYPVTYILAFIFVIIIINRKGNPIFKLTWMIPMIIAPLFTCFAYMVVELQVGSRFLKKRTRTMNDKSKRYLVQESDIIRKLSIEDPSTANLARYTADFASAPIYKNVGTKYFASGEEMFPCLIEELEKAETFIFLEFFIIEEGKVWNAVLDILERKVKEGVEVRVIYDGLCSLFQLPPGYFHKLRKKGIKAKAFSRMIPFFTTTQNNRDHRKIVVIDGKTAFTGGINLADEYMNYKRRFGYWKDTGVMLRGDVVKSFTVMFLEMWSISEKTISNFDRYINAAADTDEASSGYVIGFADSPFDGEQIGENVYIDILNTARRYVHIITPYLILDYEMLQTLEFTAKRGVDVSIIMPGVPDKAYAYCLGRSYYTELIEAGVKIYEYTPGFTHAKMFISDDEKAVIGSINLDFRSLYLHFECAAYIYKNSEIAKIEADYTATRKESNMVTIMECKNRPLYYKVCGQILRIFAPLF